MNSFAIHTKDNPQAPKIAITTSILPIGIEATIEEFEIDTPEIYEAKLTLDNNEEIVTYAPSKTYQSVVICSSELKTGEDYKIYSGGNSSKNNKDGLYELDGYEEGNLVEEISISGVVNIVGNGKNGRKDIM